MDATTSQLTAPQREAVEHRDGPLLVLAGPGSGKTRVITHRIANLLRQGIPARAILALTFTNKAAQEMRRRVEQLAPGEGVWMGTFHRFCAQLLRQYAPLVGLRENYSILDTGDSKQVLKLAMELAGTNTGMTSPEQTASIISRFKNRLVLPEMLEGQSLGSREHLAARVYPFYQQQLLVANAVDFDDLLMHAARMLRDHPELRGDLDARHRYILVDEYQDTNLAQYAIVRALCVDHPNLMVTGDPDQSIYGWRGADINNILDFEKDYPQVRIVRLEENYRSTPEILHVADTLIRRNRRRKAKDLYTHNPPGHPVILRMYNDGYEEADEIALQVAMGVEGGEIRPRDVAIFCRMNAMTRSLEHAFRARGIPYQIVNGVEFYQRKEIKDVLAYLHLLNNPANDVALQRIINVPARGIGTKTLKTIQQYAAQRRISMLQGAREIDSIPGLAQRSAKKVKEFVALIDRMAIKATAPLADLLQFLLEESGYDEYLAATSVDEADNNPQANVDELISSAVEFDHQYAEPGALEAFLEQVALISDTDAWEDEDDRVTLMTLHAAKGLEFPHVYIIAVEERILPHERSLESSSQLEEERRLLFVGMTRAQRRLQLSFSRRRVVRGATRPAAPSQFLMELPRETMQIARSEDPATFTSRWGTGDDHPDQDAYPSSWDDLGGEDDICQLPDDERRETRPGGFVRESPLVQGMMTASDLLARSPSPSRAKPPFPVGTRVTHPSYGQGSVLHLSGHGEKQTAIVLFDCGERKTFRTVFAPLTAVD